MESLNNYTLDLAWEVLATNSICTFCTYGDRNFKNDECENCGEEGCNFEVDREAFNQSIRDLDSEKRFR